MQYKLNFILVNTAFLNIKIHNAIGIISEAITHTLNLKNILHMLHQSKATQAKYSTTFFK